MKIAVPIDTELKVYHGNPWTAPRFVLYELEEKTSEIHITSKVNRDNPWIGEDESIICDPMACSDGCSDMIKDDLNHLADHYILLELISGFDYLVVDTYCDNVVKVLNNANIALFKLPPFIQDPDAAVKNLLINNKYIKNVNKIITATS